MSEKEKLEKLVKAVENIAPLFIEGLSNTQYENWSEEINDLYQALQEAKK